MTLGTLLTSAAAHAASPHPPKGYQHARELQLQHACAKAIPEYDGILAGNGVGTYRVIIEYRIAECYEEEQQVTESWARFRALASGPAGTTQGLAHDREKALEGAWPTLTVELATTVTGLAGVEVRVDGVTVSFQGKAMSIPVVPGPCLVTVSATGKTPWSHAIRVEHAETVVGPDALHDVETLQTREPPVALVVPKAPGIDDSHTEPFKPVPLTEASSQATSTWSGRRTAALVTGGLGLVSLTVGAVFGVLELKEVAKLTPDKDGHTRGGSELARADYATVSNVGIATGLGLSAAAVILAVTSPSRPVSAGMMRFAPVITAERGGMVFYGSF